MTLINATRAVIGFAGFKLKESKFTKNLNERTPMIIANSLHDEEMPIEFAQETYEHKHWFKESDLPQFKKAGKTKMRLKKYDDLRTIKFKTFKNADHTFVKEYQKYIKVFLKKILKSNIRIFA